MKPAAALARLRMILTHTSGAGPGSTHVDAAANDAVGLIFAFHLYPLFMLAFGALRLVNCANDGLSACVYV